MIFSLNPNTDDIKTIKHRYVYFDDNGLINQISSHEDKDNKHNYAIFELNDVIPFIQGTYRFTDYTVVRTKNPFEYEIKKKKVQYKSRSLENQITKIDYCNSADIVVKYKNGVLTFESSDSLVKNSGITFGQDVTISGANTHPFFVTIKDRPDFILQTILVSFSDLLVGEKTEVKLETPYKEIGLYTKPYFETYSLETTI